LQDLGDPGAARPLTERALAITEAVHGPDHPDVASSLNNLALILQDLGDPGAARPLTERALAITEAVHGPDHPDVATRLRQLGELHGEWISLARARYDIERDVIFFAWGRSHTKELSRMPGRLTQGWKKLQHPKVDDSPLAAKGHLERPRHCMKHQSRRGSVVIQLEKRSSQSRSRRKLG
jgi:Tetratricopeptide repeat